MGASTAHIEKGTGKAEWGKRKKRQEENKKRGKIGKRDVVKKIKNKTYIHTHISRQTNKQTDEGTTKRRNTPEKREQANSNMRRAA